MTLPRGPEDASNLQGGYQALGALDDSMAADAIEIVIKEQQASVPLLQRKLGIGAERAIKIIDAMEKDGIIGPQIAPFVPRRVLIKEIPENVSGLIYRGQEQQSGEALPSVDAMPSVFASAPRQVAPESIPRDEYTKLQEEVASANDHIDKFLYADVIIEVDLDSRALDILRNLKEGVVVHLGGYRKQIPIENFKQLLLMPVMVAFEENFPTDSVYMDALYEAILDKKDNWVYEASVYRKIGAPSSKAGLYPERLFAKFRARVEAERANNTPTPHTFTPKPMNTPDSSDTSIETGERDPLFQKATEWISQQTGRASLTDLRLALNVPAVRTEAILVAMNDKKIVEKSGFMPFPQFFEYTPPAVPVAPTPIAAPVVAPVSTPVAPTPAPRSNPFVRPTQVAPDVSTPRLDIYDNEWTGVGDDFSGHGKVKYRNGDMEEGVFEKGVLVVGRQTYADGTFMDINMYKGNGYNGEGKKVWSDGEKHEGSYEGGALWNGTLTRPDGTVVKVVDGVQQGSSTSGAAPDTYREPIKGIRENATFGKFPKDKAAEANRGIERVENVCMGLSIEDQRRIGELHIKFMDRTPPAPGGLKGILAKRPTGVVPWRALDTNPGEGKTFVEIDPLRLPADDNEITQYLITAAKKYDNQRKAEMAIEDLERQTQVFGLTLNYDHGSPNFFKSLDGIEKIKKAMMMLDEDETGMLSRSDLLILMVGQKKEDYLDSKYRIILSCDTPQDENLIASYLRGELRRVEQEDAAGGAPSRKPTKKSVPGIFSKTRGKIAGVLAALAVAGGGAAAVHQINKKATPVDTTPAPKAPKTPKVAEKAEEVPEAPVRAPEEAPKAPEKSAAESGEVKKVDLSKIPVGGKVSFTSPEDGVKKGVLKKNSRGKYEPVDAFDFDDDDDGTVIRIQ